MILITGAGGFIGSCLLKYLNAQGLENILIVDDFHGEKMSNIRGKYYAHKIHREQLFDWLKINGDNIEKVFHLGARTDTTESNQQIFHRLNLSYSKKIWKTCTHLEIPLIYASSAATYGLGEFGFIDQHAICDKLTPLNEYAISKNEFDKWVLKQKDSPPFWAGLKFFNVYGPNEYHKGRMASVVFHGFRQIKETGIIRLFRSHRTDIKDGFQARDFIYVEDVVKLCLFFMRNQPESGIYNVGTGKARAFLDLAKAIFAAMDLPINIQYIDTPEKLQLTYQYFTEADMIKVHRTGYGKKMFSLEQGVEKYVKQYLLPNEYF